MIQTDEKHLLFIEPNRQPADVPIVDDLTRRLTAAWRKRVTPGRRYRGWHENASDPGVYSDNADHYVCGMLTHSLCIRYLAHFRDAVPLAELEKVRALPEEYAEPTADELAGRMTDPRQGSRGATR